MRVLEDHIENLEEAYKMDVTSSKAVRAAIEHSVQLLREAWKGMKDNPGITVDRMERAITILERRVQGLKQQYAMQKKAAEAPPKRRRVTKKKTTKKPRGKQRRRRTS